MPEGGGGGFLDRIRRKPQVEVPRIDHTTFNEHFSSETGLSVRQGLNIVGNELLGIPPGSVVGNIDFEPRGQTKLRPGFMTENLVMGIEGLQQYFGAIESGRIQHEPNYLQGRSSEQMINTLGRLGFAIYPAEEGVRKYPVAVGETATVRDKLQEYTEVRDEQGRTVLDRLRSRLDS